jgi:glycosyltransferase involved in cell wall biosynthesis
MVRAIDTAVALSVAPNGCPPVLAGAAQAPGGGAPAGPNGTAPMVLYLGALRESKGIMDALRVAARVTARVPAARFVFAGQWGSAPEQAAAERLVQELGLSGNVVFPGAVGAAEKAALFQAASVYLLTSHGEGHPWSVIEAMSAGVPVVATRTGAVPDTVTHGKTGYLEEVGDVPRLAEAVVRIIGEPDLAAEMSSAGRERYELYFTVERSHSVLRDALISSLRSG